MAPPKGKGRSLSLTMERMKTPPIQTAQFKAKSLSPRLGMVIPPVRRSPRLAEKFKSPPPPEITEKGSVKRKILQDAEINTKRLKTTKPEQLGSSGNGDTFAKALTMQEIQGDHVALGIENLGSDDKRPVLLTFDTSELAENNESSDKQAVDTHEEVNHTSDSESGLNSVLRPSFASSIDMASFYNKTKETLEVSFDDRTGIKMVQESMAFELDRSAIDLVRPPSFLYSSGEEGQTPPTTQKNEEDETIVITLDENEEHEDTDRSGDADTTLSSDEDRSRMIVQKEAVDTHEEAHKTVQQTIMLELDRSAIDLVGPPSFLYSSGEEGQTPPATQENEVDDTVVIAMDEDEKYEDEEHDDTDQAGDADTTLSSEEDHESSDDEITIMDYHDDVDTSIAANVVQDTEAAVPEDVIEDIIIYASELATKECEPESEMDQADVEPPSAEEIFDEKEDETEKNQAAHDSGKYFMAMVPFAPAPRRSLREQGLSPDKDDHHGSGSSVVSADGNQTMETTPMDDSVSSRLSTINDILLEHELNSFDFYRDLTPQFKEFPVKMLKLLHFHRQILGSIRNPQSELLLTSGLLVFRYKF